MLKKNRRQNYRTSVACLAVAVTLVSTTSSHAILLATPSVPDTGSTFGLLGGALVAICWLYRRVRK